MSERVGAAVANVLVQAADPLRAVVPQIRHALRHPDLEAGGDKFLCPLR